MAAVLFAALSVSERIKTYGAYAGFAAVLGLAVLALLYFAQAREVKRLREWAGRAPERALELEQRVQADATRRAALAARPVAAQTPAAQAAAAPASEAATAAAQSGPAPPGQPGAPPAPAVAGKAPATPGTPTPAATPGASTPGAPAGAGAAAPATPAAPGTAPKAATPADGAATPAKPGDPAPAPAPAAPGPTPKPAPAAAAATGAGPPTKAAGDPGGGALGTMPPAPRLPTVSPPAPPARTASTVAGSSGGGRPRGSRSSGRSPAWGLAAAGLVLVVGLVLLLTQVFGGDGDKKPLGSRQTPTQVIPEKQPGTPVKTDFDVTVLNGTTVLNLARSVSDRISAKGYEVVKVDNAPEQGRAATVIMFTPGHRQDAFTIARLIGVGRDSVQALDANTQVVSEGAAVVVTVGADQAPQ